MITITPEFLGKKNLYFGTNIGFKAQPKGTGGNDYIPHLFFVHVKKSFGFRQQSALGLIREVSQ